MTGPVTLEEPKGVHGSRIVSEASTSSRTTSHDQRRKEPLILSPCQGPELTRKVDTNPSLDDDVAPQVPPKALSRENKPLILAKTGVLHQAAFASSSNDVPNAVPKSVLPYSKAVAQRSEIPKLAEALSSTKPASGASESTEAPIWTFRDRSFLDGACLNLGRPMIRSNSPVSRSRSTTKSSYVEVCNSRQLPKGLSIAEAKRQLSPFDIVNLRQQAHRHARNFEVLAGTDVNQLSRVSNLSFLLAPVDADALQALHVFDKRCEYLRKIYESLRANRQKLYSSMISGLERTKSVIFSRESLLVQKEALAELDNSIDEWILKLEQAEDRSLKVRQKLLEHIAAASILHPVVPNET